MRPTSALSTVAWAAFVGLFIFALSVPADARDRSGVLKASDLVGMKVQGTDGKNLGTIKDLVIDQEDGAIQYAVLDFGGFAGIGDKYFAVPWDALHLDQANQQVALDLHKRDLKDAPGFDKNNWPNFNDDQQQVMIYEFYEVPPPSEEHAAVPIQ